MKTQKFGWWIEILVDNPTYVYYFGAFNSYWEAESSKNGYIQDLKGEGAKLIDIQVKQYQPEQLTISLN